MGPRCSTGQSDRLPPWQKPFSSFTPTPNPNSETTRLLLRPILVDLIQGKDSTSKTLNCLRSSFTKFKWIRASKGCGSITSIAERASRSNPASQSGDAFRRGLKRTCRLIAAPPGSRDARHHLMNSRRQLAQQRTEDAEWAVLAAD